MVYVDSGALSGLLEEVLLLSEDDESASFRSCCPCLFFLVAARRRDIAFVEQLSKKDGRGFGIDGVKRCFWAAYLRVKEFWSPGSGPVSSQDRGWS